MWPFKQKAATSQPPAYNAGGWRRVLEPFSGAWQRGEYKDVRDLTAYPTLYACLDRISADIGKLPFVTRQPGSDGVRRVVASDLRLVRPNHYQTPSMFRAAWMLSKLTHGNTVCLVQPDALYILDWEKVTPLISDSGQVFYRLALGDTKNLLPPMFSDGQVTIPASNIIHDRGPCLQNQLIGVPPITAAYYPALQNHYILKNNADQFSKGNEMGGLLTIPAGVSDDDAKAIKDYWQSTDPQSIRVIGADAKFSPFTAKSTDSQVVETLTLSDKQICAPFHVPAFIVGAESLPSGQRPESYISMYFKTALQHHVERMESLLTQGLNLARGQHVTLDTSELLRLDTQARGDYLVGMVKGGIMTRNEARHALDLPKVNGGDELHVQQQDVPLSQAGGAE